VIRKSDAQRGDDGRATQDGLSSRKEQGDCLTIISWKSIRSKVILAVFIWNDEEFSFDLGAKPCACPEQRTCV